MRVDWFRRSVFIERSLVRALVVVLACLALPSCATPEAEVAPTVEGSDYFPKALILRHAHACQLLDETDKPLMPPEEWSLSPRGRAELASAVVDFRDRWPGRTHVVWDGSVFRCQETALLMMNGGTIYSAPYKANKMWDYVVEYINEPEGGDKRVLIAIMRFRGEHGLEEFYRKVLAPTGSHLPATIDSAESRKWTWLIERDNDSGKLRTTAIPIQQHADECLEVCRDCR